MTSPRLPELRAIALELTTTLRKAAEQTRALDHLVVSTVQEGITQHDLREVIFDYITDEDLGLALAEGEILARMVLGLHTNRKAVATYLFDRMGPFAGPAIVATLVVAMTGASRAKLGDCRCPECKAAGKQIMDTVEKVLARERERKAAPT